MPDLGRACHNAAKTDRPSTCESEINPAARTICAAGKIQIRLGIGLIQMIGHRRASMVPTRRDHSRR